MLQNKVKLERHTKEKHTTSNEEVKNFHCTKCDFKTNRKQALETHIKEIYDKIKDRKWCPQCDYAATHRTHLCTHIKSVHLKIKDKKWAHC